MIAFLPAAVLALCAEAIQEPKVEEEWNLRIVRPKDWTRQKMADGSIWLSPPGLEKGRVCAIVLTSGKELTVKPREGFDQEWRDFTKDWKVTAGEVETRRGEGFETYSRTGVMEKDGVALCVNLVSFTPGNCLESIIYLSNSRDLYDLHIKTLVEFVEKLGFGNVKKPEPVKLMLEGAWMRGGWTFDPTGSTGERAPQSDFLFFYKDSVACRGWQSEGQDGLVLKPGLPPSQAAFWGRRTEKNGEIHVAWGAGGETVFTKEDGNALKTGREAPYRPLPSCDKLALDGLYRTGDGKLSDGGKQWEIRFTPEGRFEEQNLCSRVMREGPAKGAGKYRIVTYTLILEYDGGPTVRMGFHVLKKPESKVEPIYLNTFAFSRAR